MRNYAQLASFHRAALLLGLTSGETVIAWADEAITNDDDAPAALYDVAMVPSHDLSELRHALQPLAARDESLSVVRALLDRVRGAVINGNRNIPDTITVLAQARRFLTVPLNYFDEIDTLQDDHMLAVAGVTGNVAVIEERTCVWLNQFAGGESAFLEEFPC